jgi:hypothetical protein
MSRTISQHIDDDKNELDKGDLSPQRKRHLESELKDLESYHSNHPDDEHDPTSFEIYCDQNPNALECRIYED